MKRLALNKTLEKMLKPALYSGAASVFQEIKQGRSILVQTSNKKLLAVIRFENRQMVIVAVVGNDLFGTRSELIAFAKANQAHSIRFHTIYPERLKKGTEGLPIHLIDKRSRFLGRPEYVYQLQVN